jgi:hypothetical protein
MTRYHAYVSDVLACLYCSLTDCTLIARWCLLGRYCNSGMFAKFLIIEQGPNDEHANEQQDLAHHMYLVTLDGRLHLAPLHNPQVNQRGLH